MKAILFCYSGFFCLHPQTSHVSKVCINTSISPCKTNKGSNNISTSPFNTTKGSINPYILPSNPAEGSINTSTSPCNTTKGSINPYILHLQITFQHHKRINQILSFNPAGRRIHQNLNFTLQL